MSIFRQTWRDWKSNVLKTQAEHKRYAGGTGGGPPKKIIFTEIEEDLLDFLTPDASGLSHIPEAGFSNQSFHQQTLSDNKKFENHTVRYESNNNLLSIPKQSKSGSVFKPDLFEVRFFKNPFILF